mmetsp:Transcript_32094/g.51639  ORF Transcript_32094/g.51639 Transcript_32094/m.51639 type:complete len:160 (+) Transcript_32094:49-528(+)
MESSDGFPPSGFKRCLADPYQDHLGPFYYHPEERVMTVRVSSHMCNAIGVLHGGALMSFCDAALFVIAREHTFETTGRTYVTLSMNIDFMGRCREGALVLAGGEVVKVSSDKDLILVQGWAKAGGASGRVLCVFRGMLKFAPKVSPSEHNKAKGRRSKL